MYGIALEGGGAKGAYHIGAMKALYENGYEIGGYVGTSIGSFNAAILAQCDFDKLYNFWYNGSISDLIDISESDLQKFLKKKIDFPLIKSMGGYIKKIKADRGIDISKYRKVISDMVDEDKLRNSGKDYGLVTVSVTDKKNLELFKEDIPKGEIEGYIMASSYIPVFKMEKINEKYYIDGGFYDNCPVNMLIRKGYTDIISIRTGAIGISRKIKGAQKINLIEIRPSKDLGGILVADNRVSRNNIKMGYYDTLRVIKGIKGTTYYINPLEENEFFNMLLNLSDESIYKLAGKTIKNAQDYDPKKLLFEKIIPAISKKIRSTDTKTYNDFAYNLIEFLLEYDGTAEVYKIHDFDEIIALLKKQANMMAKKERANIVPNSTVEMIIRLITEI